MVALLGWNKHCGKKLAAWPWLRTRVSSWSRSSVKAGGFQPTLAGFDQGDGEGGTFDFARIGGVAQAFGWTTH